MASKKVLVTGGAGFIGSHIVDALCEKHEVAVIDDLSTGRIENLRNSKSRITFYKKNILGRDLKEALKDVEVVFHLAAQVNVRKSVDDPFYDLDVNGKGVLNIVENAENLEQFIYASSGGAVYGEPKYLPADEHHETNPISPYGVSKLIGEKYLYCYSHNYGLKVTCLRYANVYGERQDPLGEAGVISIFINRILKNKPPIIFGDGRQTRDYVHVSDIVKANLLAMRKEGIFNIGTGIETSVNQLADIISKIGGKKIKPVHTEERKGEVRRISLSISKAKKELKWSPKIELKEGIQRTFEWFKFRK